MKILDIIIKTRPLFEREIKNYSKLKNREKNNIQTYASFANANNIDFIELDSKTPLTPWQDHLFQIILKESDKSDSIFSIGAPTSFGKSRIARLFSLGKMSNNRILILVQEKTLINDYIREFKEMGVTENIFQYITKENSDNNGVFVLTQERLNGSKNDYKNFDFTFVDEAHWLRDSYIHLFKKDGLIINNEFSLRRQEKFISVLKSLSHSKIFLLLPMTDKKIINEISKMYMKISGKEVVTYTEKFDITSRSGIFKDDSGFKWINEFVLSDTKREDIISKYHKIENGEYPIGSLIYCSKGKMYEKTKELLMKDLIGVKTESKSLTLSQKVYGKEHMLTKLISKKIAYHNGSIYPFLRGQIEKDFRNKNIEKLFANQTIIRGINIQPSFLILESYKLQNSSYANYVRFSNLFGRTGRLSGKRHGIIMFMKVTNSNPLMTSAWDALEHKEDSSKERDASTLIEVKNAEKLLDLTLDCNSDAELIGLIKDEDWGEGINKINKDFYSIAEDIVYSISLHDKSAHAMVEETINRFRENKHWEIQSMMTNWDKFINFIPVVEYGDVKSRYYKGESAIDECFGRLLQVMDLITERLINEYGDEVNIHAARHLRYSIFKKIDLQHPGEETLEIIKNVSDVYDLID